MQKSSETTADPSALQRPVLPVTYERVMLEILEERGIARADSLRAAGIDPGEVEQVNGRVTLEQCARLVLYALRVTGDGGLGYELGLRLKPSVHGLVGFAAMTGATLNEALSVAAKHLRARMPQLRLVVEREGEVAVIELCETFALPVLREFFCECVLVGFAQSAMLICEDRPDLEIWFDWPEPDYYERYRVRLPRIRFNRRANQIRLPTSFLDARLLFSDEDAHREALAQVEHEALVGKDDDFVTRADAALRRSLDGYASLPSLAKRLGVSPRTLRRKLASSGSSYRSLLNQARYRDARSLLETSELDVVGIGKQLGFDSPPSFTRAFKQWAQTTPSEYRARLRKRS